MRKTNNKRTLYDITKYIQVASQEGVLQESMMSIAGHTGYSNATVHRALQTLEEQGVVRVVISNSAKEPATIYYHGPDSDETSELLQRATYAMSELSKATQQVESVMNDLRMHMSLVDRQTHTPLH